MTIRIIKQKSDETLLHHYSGQSSAQPAEVRLSMDGFGGGVLSADWNGEIGSAVPATVWHGRELRWNIPALLPDAANMLLDDIGPLADELVDEYTCSWDGSNHVGRLTERGQEIRDEITLICQCAFDDEDNIECEESDDA